MPLTTNQISILQRVNKQLERGDITKISKRADFTKEYVGKVLNPFSDTYNQEIINAAIELIAEKKQGQKSQKEIYSKLPA